MKFSALETDTHLFALHDGAKYCQIMGRIIAEHERLKNPEWRGHIPEAANSLLRQFAAHCGLQQSVLDDCIWSIYASVLPKRTLDFLLLLNLIRRRRNAMTDRELGTMFWNAAEKFNSVALSLIRCLKNHPEVGSDPRQLAALLESLKEFHVMAPYRPGFTNMPNRIVDAITMGASDKWNRAFGERRLEGPICDGDRIENAIRMCQEVMADVNKELTGRHGKVFLRHWRLSPSRITYAVRLFELMAAFHFDV